MRQTQERVLAYTPRPQFIPFHQRTQRWSCVVAHRRAGKTVKAVNELVVRALHTRKKNARFAYIAPFYSQAKDIAWTYLQESGRPFATSDKEIRQSELRVRLMNGAWVTLYGADSPDSLRGKYFDGVVLDEYGDCRPSLWGEIILPCLADRRGWAHFIGTPKGRNHFYDLYKRAANDPKWYTLMLKASTSGLLPQDELNEIRLQMTDSQYQQEMECDFAAAVMGTYYADLINQLETKQQIGPRVCQYDPEQPVHVASDLGYTDSTAMWFWQHRPDGIAVIDYHEAQGEMLSYYFDHLRSRPYEYDTIWLPHDARAKTLQTGRSTVEQFISAGFPVKITPNLKIQHGIDAARYVLPHCWIDTNMAGEGVEALRAYRRKYNEITKAFADTPLHDWSSDGADAFRYMALVCRERVLKKPPKRVIVDQRGMIISPDMTLDRLHDDRKSNQKSQINRMRI